MIKKYIGIPKALFCLFTAFLSYNAQAVTVAANSRGSLPSVLVESSAIDYTGGPQFWSLNDSGDPEIHCIADDGSFVRTVSVSNAHCRNWEDLTHDVNRNYMYIGDFGNNACDRTNLRIFRIPYPSAGSPATVAADEIDFAYSDQNHIPSNWLNFDVEAFFHFQNHLYLFTKTDGNAVGWTKMYSLPDQPGNYAATLVDSFYTNDRTTSADISPDGTSMILISNTHIHLFRNFSGADFFHGQHQQINIAGGWTQKEAVTFSTNNEIFLTDENTGGGNHLYYIDMSTYIPTVPVVTTSINKITDDAAFAVYPMPARDYVNILAKNKMSANLSISLFDLTGKMIYQSPIDNETSPFVINTAIFPTGIYFCRIYADAKEVQTSRLIISH